MPEIPEDMQAKKAAAYKKATDDQAIEFLRRLEDGDLIAPAFNAALEKMEPGSRGAFGYLSVAVEGEKGERRVRLGLRNPSPGEPHPGAQIFADYAEKNGGSVSFSYPPADWASHWIKDAPYPQKVSMTLADFKRIFLPVLAEGAPDHITSALPKADDGQTAQSPSATLPTRPKESEDSAETVGKVPPEPP